MIRALTVAAVGLLAAGACIAAEKEAISKRAPRDVAPDTNPQSAFWKAAPAVFLEKDSRGNDVPGYRTEVRSRWTDSNLYFLFICPYEKLFLKPGPNTAAETNELWKWDVAEAFIGADFEHIRHYREFEVSPRAEWVDLDINLDAGNVADRWKWNSAFQVAARVDEKNKVWYACMRIPYRSIDVRPTKPGNTLRINFYLSEGEAPNHKGLCWQPTGQRTFHVPESFGILRLSK